MEDTKPVPNGQVDFQYTDEALVTFEKYLSPERLAPYYALARSNKWIGIQLYERNTELSEALYGVIQGLEIALRNAIHNVMSSGLGAADWYDRMPFDDPERESIDEAKEKIREKPLPITPGRVVAELTFGFWVKLTASSYEKSLWVRYLYRIFPLKVKRSILHGRLVDLKTLRNRIAHHERIVGKRDLRQDYRNTLEAIGWINPCIQNWVQHTNCFQARWDKKFKRDRPLPEKPTAAAPAVPVPAVPVPVAPVVAAPVPVAAAPVPAEALRAEKSKIIE
jgi:hypothetical protein